MSFRMIFPFAMALFAIGCQREPETLREKAEQAQKELEEARDDAAEMIAEAEEDAVETVADAREEAEADLKEAKRKAAEKVEEAERELKDRLDQLSDPSFLEEEPPAIEEEVDTEGQPKVRIEAEIEKENPDE